MKNFPVVLSLMSLSLAFACGGESNKKKNVAANVTQSPSLQLDQPGKVPKEQSPAKADIQSFSAEKTDIVLSAEESESDVKVKWTSANTDTCTIQRVTPDATVDAPVQSEGFSVKVSESTKLILNCKNASSSVSAAVDIVVNKQKKEVAPKIVEFTATHLKTSGSPFAFPVLKSKTEGTKTCELQETFVVEAGEEAHTSYIGGYPTNDESPVAVTRDVIFTLVCQGVDGTEVASEPIFIDHTVTVSEEISDKLGPKLTK
ncbi:MAG: hypothetical protein EOP04_08905 [Proteobacteria bacterium]|nr:MAG: hypothetical protein EOP04_08905 [Pseudomonadota bacterium]